MGGCLGLLLLFTECSKECPEAETGSAQGNVRLELTLDTREADASAIGNEAYIVPEDIHVFLFEQKENQWVYYDRMSYPMLMGDKTGPYTLTGTIYTSQAIDLSNFRFVVLANLSGGCPLSESSSLYPAPGSGLQAFYNQLVYNYGNQPQQLFTQHIMTSEHDNARIPMWGVTTPQELTWTAENTFNLGSINMLRAMAKIEVKLSTDLQKEYRLIHVNLMHCNQKGMLTPAGAVTMDTTPAEGFGINLPPDPETLLSTAVTFYEGSNNVFTLYCPELAERIPPATETQAGTDNHEDYQVAHMHVCLRHSQGDEAEYPLYFANTKDNHLVSYPVLRNHFYTITITGVKEGELNYTVDAWTEHEGDIVFE